MYNLYCNTYNTSYTIVKESEVINMTRENKYPETTTFHFHNQNPRNRITGDCVFRAISLGTGKDYNDCVMELSSVNT